MPYSKTPQTSTYQTKKISLLAEMNSRGTLPTTDVDYINCFAELFKNKTTQENNTFLRKRDGYEVFLTLAGTARAMYYWEDQDRLFFAIGRNVYIYSFPAGALLATLVNVYGTSSGDVGFTEFLYDTGTVKVVTTDGTTLSTIDSANVVVASADPDLPSPHLTCPVFLDGYLFLVKSNTADLYNSDLNDPLAFTPGNFISSELIPDRATWVVKLNNYILLFGNDSIEYFWDAANDSGSPLQRNDTPVKFTGLIGGIAQLGSKIYFVGDTDHSQANVFMLEDLKITPVGNEVVSRYLNGITANLYANIISMAGFDFYVLYAGDYTYVMELESKLWSRWTIGSNTYFNMQLSYNCRNAFTNYTLFTLTGSSVVYKFSPTLYQDSGTSITTVGIGPNEEFDTMNRKFMFRLAIWADKPTASSPLLIQWTDDDYQTYNTGISVDLYQQMPTITRLGFFRRRAFKWTHTANQPLRLKGGEVDINMGQN